MTMSIYLLLIVFFIVLICAFLLYLESGILVFFICSTSFQYLEHISLLNLTALDYFGIFFPMIFFIGLFFNNKNLFNIFLDNYLIKHYFIIIMIFLFCGVLFTGMVYPLNTNTSLIERLGVWFKLINNFSILISINLLFIDSQKVNTLLNCMLLSLLVPASLFSYQIITGETIFNYRTGYSFATAYFHHPGVIAYALVFHFPISLLKLYNSTSIRDKIFWVVIIMIFLCLIYFTYRRGAWLALLFQLSIYFFFLQKNKFKISFLYLSLFLIFIFSFTTISSIFIDRFSDVTILFDNFWMSIETHTYDDLFSGRWGFYRSNFIYLFNQPIFNMLFGNGIGATYFIPAKLGVAGGGHNIYLILLIDYGIIGFLAYISFLFAIFIKLLGSLHSPNPFISSFSKMLITLFISYLIIGMVTHVLYSNAPNWLFFGLLGAFLGVDNSSKNKLVMHKQQYILKNYNFRKNSIELIPKRG